MPSTADPAPLVSIDFYNPSQPSLGEIRKKTFGQEPITFSLLRQSFLMAQGCFRLISSSQLKSLIRTRIDFFFYHQKALQGKKLGTTSLSFFKKKRKLLRAEVVHLKRNVKFIHQFQPLT